MILVNLFGPLSVFKLCSLPLIVLAGILADGWIGRYRGVMASFIFWLITCIFVGVSMISTSIPILAFGIASLLITSALFRANIIPFNIDQLIEASGNELSAIVQWHFLGSTVSSISTASLRYSIADEQIGVYWYVSGYLNIYLFAPGGLAFLVVIISHSLFKQWLDITHHSTNPVKLVAKVLNYARKNKQPTNRSALTFWLDDYPPRLDVGKEKYDGPFSEEEVEDVKTVLRLIPLILCFTCFGSTWDYKWQLIPHVFAGISYCLVQLTSLEFILAQTPKSMRGILVGLWYSISGLMSIVNILLILPFFNIKSGPLGCSFYYFLTKSVLSLIVLMVFLILAKRYKLCVRENEICVYVDVHRCFTRYLDEEERCRR